MITYEGITRVERFMFSREAFREIVLNAIVHKDYSSCNPVQISVYPDKIYVWNNGNMPKNLDSVEKLFGKHSSDPFNPNLAQVFFKSGLIEAWGRGFDKIRKGCEEYGGELPGYEISENGIMVLCKACPAYLNLLKSGAGTTNGSKGKDEMNREDNADSREDNADNKTLVINAIARNSRLTVRQLATELPISKATVERTLKALQKVGKLRRVGGTRGVWEIVC